MNINRRNLVANIAATVAVASVSRAEAADGGACGLPPKNIIYTQENPGQWSGKVALHVPSLEVSGDKVTLKTPHSMSAEHYIVRHTVILADGTVLGAKVFKPTDVADSEYELPKGYSGKIYGTSFCNLHDFWMVETTI
jgi:superoxide reductase